LDKSTLALHNGLFAVKESFVHNQICSQKMFFNRATSSKTMPKKGEKRRKKGKQKKGEKQTCCSTGSWLSRESSI
jgi:hypothetical protein